jgi:hypothetical protein
MPVFLGFIMIGGVKEWRRNGYKPYQRTVLGKVRLVYDRTAV